MTSADQVAVPENPVVAELPRRASKRLRLAHVASAATLRRLLDLAVGIDRRGTLTPGQMLFVAGRFDALVKPLRPARGTRLRPVAFTDFRAEWVWDDTTGSPDDTHEPAAILYFHGGGLVSCGLNTHRRMVARIARTAGIPLLNVDYRQIPGAHVTETVEDCVQTYRYLLAREIPPERIIVAGDSAGGGLTFALALAVRRLGLPMPGGIVAIAPWADYDSVRRRAHPNDPIDPLLSADAFAMCARWGIERDAVLDPLWSPVNNDLTGLPPVLIQVGSTEVLLSDSELLAQQCAKAGVPLTLQIWDRAIHVFQVGADFLPDAREAIADIGTFMREILAEATSRQDRASA